MQTLLTSWNHIQPINNYMIIPIFYNLIQIKVFRLFSVSRLKFEAVCATDRLPKESLESILMALDDEK